MRASTSIALAVALLSAWPAHAQRPADPPSGATASASLGGGGDVGSGGTTGLSELEVIVGYDAGEIRPEVGLGVGLSPGTYAIIRPGVHYPLPGLPFYARGALDFAHDSGEWRFRWILVGAGAELRATSVLSVFVEADGGVPLTGETGLGLLVRGGIQFRL